MDHCNPHEAGQHSPSFILQLTALPDTPVPATVRLRAALKRLLRTYRLRCDRVEPVEGGQP